MGCDGLAETAGDSFDHAAHIEHEFHPVDFFQRKSGDPLAKLAGDFRVFYPGVPTYPLGDAPIDTGAEGFHEIVGERGGSLADDVADAEGGVQPDGEEVL